VIDIGAGKDLVAIGAERFDIEDGDANKISKYRQRESYDCVHSSHCLEHMFDAQRALEEWWSLVKPGGYLVVVVPEEDLYEQGIWPSIFNDDHKSTFRFNKMNSWSPVSYDIEALASSLPHAKIISIELHDDYYDYSLQTRFPAKRSHVPAAVSFLKKIMNRVPLVGRYYVQHFENFLFKYFQYPIDQTMREALAQIQIVVMKNKNRG
jgi:SAM-dependent methyltransferase